MLHSYFLSIVSLELLPKCCPPGQPPVYVQEPRHQIQHTDGAGKWLSPDFDLDTMLQAKSAKDDALREVLVNRQTYRSHKYNLAQNTREFFGSRS